MAWFQSRRMKCPKCDGDKVLKDADGNVVEDADGKATPCPECRGKGTVITPSMM